MIMPLELRPNCECCDRDLPPDSGVAYICTFECTFCADCATKTLGLVCPNCGGELVRRPTRPPEKLLSSPASTVRIVRPTPCTGPHLMQSPAIKIELNKENAFTVLAYLSRLLHKNKLEIPADAEHKALRVIYDCIDDELVETFREDYKKFVKKLRN